MFTSLRARLWLSYAALIVTAMAVMTVALGVYLLRNPVLYRQTLTRLRTVQTGIVNRQDELTDQSLPMAIDRAATTFDVRILLFDRSGELLIDSDPLDARIGVPKNINLNRSIPTFRDEDGVPWVFSQQNLEDGSTLVIAVQRPRVPLLVTFRDELMPLFLRGGVIALLSSLALALWVARWVADPLQQLVAASQHQPVTETRPVSERGPREVRELTHAFNEMIVRLRSSQASQRNFVANVSHELKTPLTSIQGFAQAILDGTASTPSEQKQAAEVIYNETGRMHRMVLDLLDLARLDAGTADLNMAPVNTPALLDSIVEKFSLQAQKAGILLSTEVPPNLPVLIADGDRLAQVFTNLVDNALRHTSSGGKVTLQTQSTQTELVFRVIDNGTGISEKALPHIFERFYQADSSRPGGEKHGAGLGLSIVQEIVAAHGGKITVRSLEGQGTTFIVILPLVGQAVKPSGKEKDNSHISNRT